MTVRCLVLYLVLVSSKENEKDWGSQSLGRHISNDVHSSMFRSVGPPEQRREAQATSKDARLSSVLVNLVGKVRSGCFLGKVIFKCFC